MMIAHPGEELPRPLPRAPAEALGAACAPMLDKHRARRSSAVAQRTAECGGHRPPTDDVLFRPPGGETTGIARGFYADHLRSGKLRVECTHALAPITQRALMNLPVRRVVPADGLRTSMQVNSYKHCHRRLLRPMSNVRRESTPLAEETPTSCHHLRRISTPVVKDGLAQSVSSDKLFLSKCKGLQRRIVENAITTLFSTHWIWYENCACPDRGACSDCVIA